MVKALMGSIMFILLFRDFGLSKATLCMCMSIVCVLCKVACAVVSMPC